MGNTNCIKVSIESGVCRLQFMRPEKRNALTFDMYACLAASMKEADQSNEVFCVLIEGSEGVFSAGTDLKQMLASTQTGQVPSEILAFIDGLLEFSKPLIVIVDGNAIGIGATLLLHADYVLATERSIFSFPFSRLGFVPEAGSSFLLPQIVGLRLASQWLMSGEMITSQKAYEAGLINQYVEEGGDISKALGTQLQIWRDQPLSALIATKRLLLAPQKETLKQVIREEARVFASQLQDPDTQKILKQFLNR